ncbi:MAG TPA: PAS domain S-box protein [Mariprofundaceae bacterium]|nr:PAS domain S-box protein [Mariprofundaceae bacterium]
MDSRKSSIKFESGWKLCDLWEWAIDHGPAIVLIADTEGRIVYVNRRFTEITGYQPEEALGNTPRVLKSGKTSPQVYASLWETIKAGEVWTGEILNRRKDGSLFWEEERIIPVCDTEGNVQHFVLFGKDISDRKRLEEEASRLLEENRRLERKVMLVEQSEREHLAQELHDNMGQYLAAVKIEAVRMLARIGDRQHSELAASANNIIADTEALFDLVHGLTLRLQPDMISQVGLDVALHQLVWRWQLRTGVECILDIKSELDRLSDAVATTVYSIVRECLTNVLKHANAKHVRIDIKGKRKRSTKEDVLSVSICDDGQGLSAGSQEHVGLGIIGMRERVASLGGRLRILRRGKNGVCVLAVLPVYGKK